MMKCALPVSIAVFAACLAALWYVTRPPIVWDLVTFPDNAQVCPGELIEFEIQGRVVRDGGVEVVSDWKEVPADGNNSVTGTPSSIVLPALKGEFYDKDASVRVPEFLPPGTYQRVVMVHSLGGFSRAGSRINYVEVLDCGK